MSKKKSHYENLGVPKDATADQIKRAYRGKARETHPDRGGDADTFAAVADAYDVLRDPQRRLLYDATGQDRQRSIEDEVQQMLLTMFSAALSADVQTDIVAAMRHQINAGGKHLRSEAKRLSKLREKLEKRRSRIKTTAAVNLAHMVIDREVDSINQALASLDHQHVLEKALLKELDAYSDEQEPPKTRPFAYPTRSDYPSFIIADLLNNTEL